MPHRAMCSASGLLGKRGPGANSISMSNLAPCVSLMPLHLGLHADRDAVSRRVGTLKDDTVQLTCRTADELRLPQMMGAMAIAISGPPAPPDLQLPDADIILRRAQSCWAF